MAPKHRKERRLWIVSIKKHYKCRACGMDEVCCLTFHHLDKTTKNHKICKCMTNFSKKLIREEINKCVVLCLNCHAKTEKGFLKVGKEHLCKINERFQPT